MRGEGGASEVLNHPTSKGGVIGLWLSRGGLCPLSGLAACLFGNQAFADSQHFDARGQRGWLHIQQFGGTAGTEDLAAGSNQRRDDIGAVTAAALVVGENGRLGR